MDEQASFEARAVLAPRRARRARLALLLPALALVVIAWAGLSGTRSDRATAEAPEQTAAAAPSLALEEPFPAQVIGLTVKRLADVQAQRLGRDDVVAIAGWYIPTAINDCPPLTAFYRSGWPSGARGGVDEWAFCVRSGVLYASRPGLEARPPAKHLADTRADNAGLLEVAVTLAIGIFAPQELEMIGAGATHVVVVGRFVTTGDACGAPAGCRRELVVDHVGWTPGA